MFTHADGSVGRMSPLEALASGSGAGGAAASEPIIEITPEALAQLTALRDEEADAELLGLRLEIASGPGEDFRYDLSFDEYLKAGFTDEVRTHDGLKVIIPAKDVELLRGATLDHSGTAGLVIRNPNRPNPLAGVELELTGDLADKVQQLLAEAINPSLASHGGYASLVGVEGTKVFLSMGGGCQGCALSAATLREGIQTAIREAIPEVTDIIDVTDHEAGENPYY